MSFQPGLRLVEPWAGGSTRGDCHILRNRLSLSPILSLFLTLFYSPTLSLILTLSHSQIEGFLGVRQCYGDWDLQNGKDTDRKRMVTWTGHMLRNK